MKVEVTNIFVNGSAYSLRSPQTLMADILSSIQGLNYWSYESLRELYKGLIEMICDLCLDLRKEKKKGVGTARFLSQALIQLKYIPRSRDVLLRKIFDIILSSEGLPPLRGFGVSNQFGDNLRGDPERQSLNKIENRRMGT